MGWLIEIINRDNPSALFDGYLQRVRHVVWPIWELGGWPGKWKSPTEGHSGLGCQS